MSSPPAVAPTEFSPADIRKLLTGLMLALLMAALDQTIVAVALPRISTDLQGFELLAWVASGYLVAAAVATPIYGKLGDLYGRRTMMLSAIWIFLIASVLCAMAESMTMLVAARVLQGIGGGGLFSVTQAAVADVVTPRERGRYQSYFSFTYATASVAGPLVGGMLTQYLSWRWIFWVNLPLGLAALLISRSSLRRLPVPGIRRSIDYVGATLLCSGLSLAMIGLTRVGQGDAWLSVINLRLYLAAGAIMTVFFWQQSRTKEPIFPRALFRIPAIVLCCAILFFSFSQLISISIMVPLQLQMVAGMGAHQAALHLVPLTLSCPLGALIGGQVILRTGRCRPVLRVATILLPLSLVALAFCDPANSWLRASLLAIAGIAIGLQLPTCLVAVQHASPRQHLGIATAFTAFTRQLGAAIGIAVLTAILMGAMSQNAAGALAAMSGAEVMKELVGGTLASMPAAERLALAATAESAFRQALLVCAGLTVMSFLLVFKLPDAMLHDKLK